MPMCQSFIDLDHQLYFSISRRGVDNALLLKVVRYDIDEHYLFEVQRSPNPVTATELLIRLRKQLAEAQIGVCSNYELLLAHLLVKWSNEPEYRNGALRYIETKGIRYHDHLLTFPTDVDGWPEFLGSI